MFPVRIIQFLVDFGFLNTAIGLQRHFDQKHPVSMRTNDVLIINFKSCVQNEINQGWRKPDFRTKPIRVFYRILNFYNFFLYN